MPPLPRPAHLLLSYLPAHPRCGALGGRGRLSPFLPPLCLQGMHRQGPLKLWPARLVQRLVRRSLRSVCGRRRGGGGMGRPSRPLLVSLSRCDATRTGGCAYPCVHALPFLLYIDDGRYISKRHGSLSTYLFLHTLISLPPSYICSPVIRPRQRGEHV